MCFCGHHLHHTSPTLSGTQEVLTCSCLTQLVWRMSGVTGQTSSSALHSLLIHPLEPARASSPLPPWPWIREKTLIPTEPPVAVWSQMSDYSFFTRILRPRKLPQWYWKHQQFLKFSSPNRAFPSWAWAPPPGQALVFKYFLVILLFSLPNDGAPFSGGHVLLRWVV